MSKANALVDRLVKATRENALNWTRFSLRKSRGYRADAGGVQFRVSILTLQRVTIKSLYINRYVDLDASIVDGLNVVVSCQVQSVEDAERARCRETDLDSAATALDALGY